MVKREITIHSRIFYTLYKKHHSGGHMLKVIKINYQKNEPFMNQ